MSVSNKRVFFPNLDSLRFFAFLLVFLQHGFYNAFKNFEGINGFLDRIISLFFLGGGTGVQIFFVLSGFLITYLLVSEQLNTGTIDIKNFYIRRTLRIWPLYYATVIFAFLVYPSLKSLLGINSDLCSRPIYYYTFLANFDAIYIALNCPGKDAMTQGIVWSVSIEEQFYLFWPLLFIFFPQRRQWLIFLLTILVCILLRANANGPVLYFHTLAVMGDLAIGGLFAYLSINNQWFLKQLENLKKEYILFAYILIFIFYFFSDKIIVFPGSVFLGRLVFDLFWIFIILEQCFSKNSVFPLGKIKSFSKLGKVSYGLYMLHPIGILIVDIIFRVSKIDNDTFEILAIKGVVSFILSIVLAKLSFRILEQPFLKLKERFSVIKTQLV